MAFFLYASFPNSRIKPRPATSLETTPIVTCPPGVATLVLPADPNRTFVTVRNLDGTQVCYYGFAATIDGTVANGGFIIEPLEAANGIESPQDLWIFNPGPAAINVALDVGDG